MNAVYEHWRLLEIWDLVPTQTCQVSICILIRDPGDLCTYTSVSIFTGSNKKHPTDADRGQQPMCLPAYTVATPFGILLGEFTV